MIALGAARIDDPAKVGRTVRASGCVQPYRSLVATALVPAAHVTPAALEYMARSTTICAGVEPLDSTIAPNRLPCTTAPKSGPTAAFARDRGASK